MYPMTGRKKMMHFSFKKGEKGNWSQISFASVPEKNTKEVFLEYQKNQQIFVSVLVSV